MKRSPFAIAALPALVSFSFWSAIPRASADSGRWTIESAEQAALARSPRVRSAEAMRNTAHAYRTFAHVPRARNPVVNVRAMIGKPDDPAATYALLLGIPFDVAGRRRAWRNEARFIIEEAESWLAAARNDVRAQAREAYAEAMLAGAAQTVAEESAATARELFERVKARVSVSAATALDLALSESQYAEAQADVERARRGLLEAEDRFRSVLDLPPERTLELAPLPAPALPSGLTLEAARARALARRHELSAWASARERARAADNRLRAEAVGPITASVEAEQQGNRAPNRSVGASVGFELPFVFRNQGERAVARTEAASAGLERELAEHAIAREVATTFRRLETALAELALLDDRAIPAAERTLAMVQTLLDSGAVDYLRVLSARSSAFALRSRRVAALREAWLCRIALERAIGGWENP